MTKCLFRRNDGVFVGGSHWDDIEHNPATHIQVELPENPDARTKRWDGAQGVRDATAQELTDFDDAKVGAEATRQINDMKMMKALVRWVAPLVGKTPAQARSEIINVYKSL